MCGSDHKPGTWDVNGRQTLTTDVQALTWYNVWMVIDNANDTTQVYLQGGDFAAQTLLTNGGDSSFTFRNGQTDNDLLTLFIATGRNSSSLHPNATENIGPVYLDSIYIDTSGINRTNPVPEPEGLVLALVGIGAAVVFVRRRRLDCKTAG